MCVLFIHYLLFATCVYAQENPSASGPGKLRAAVLKVDVTPSIPKNLLGYGARVSTGIHDRIYHKIIVLDDGVTQFFLVVSDFCLFSNSEYDDVAQQLEKRLGIRPANFWWSVTHTHSAPEVGVPGLLAFFMGERYLHAVDTAYEREVKEKLIQGIIEARDKLEPARIGVGWGFSQANINRRAIDADDKASIGLNPDGAVDRRIGLIRIDKADGSPLALIPNYPIHGTVLGGSFTQISADVTGVVANYVEDKTGVPVVFVNGAAGNLAPIYSVYPDPESGHLSQFRVLLGDKIIEASKKIISTTDSVILFTGSTLVETPRKPNLRWPDDLSKYSRTTKEGIHTVRIPVGFLRINNDIAIWSAPVELFCEISNEIRDRSPFPYTFYYGYTNGWLGYLPTESEFKHGGYEIETVCPYTPRVQKDITEAVVGYLEGEMKTGTTQRPKARKKIK